MYIYLIHDIANTNVKPRMFDDSSRMWDTLGRYLSDVGGPYTKLAQTDADKVTIAVVEEAFIPYGISRKQSVGGC